MGEGSGLRVQGSGFRVQGSGFRVQGSGPRVEGRRHRVDEFPARDTPVLFGRVCVAFGVLHLG